MTKDPPCASPSTFVKVAGATVAASPITAHNLQGKEHV
jgi:hypothetical protein